MSEYPEHEKMKAVKEKADDIAAFLEWLFWEKGWDIAAYEENETYMVPVTLGIEKILAMYFDVDLTKIEAEKDAILAKVRAANEGAA